MGYRVGSVPYINAVPLTFGLAERGVDVVYDVPSRLPALLDSGDVDAILVSGVYPLVNPGLRMAAGVGIASRGRVMSVLVFSRLPLARVESLALDQSSMTSNRLALEVLADHGSCPRTEVMPPDLESMLDRCDACVLIGDVGMSALGSGYHEYDLGEEWNRITGLPFLWAPWVGRERLTPELASILRESGTSSGCGLAGGGANFEAVVAATVERGPFDESVVREYFTDAMVYDVDDHVMAGYEEYARRLSAPYRPALVQGSPVASAT